MAFKYAYVLFCGDRQLPYIVKVSDIADLDEPRSATDFKLDFEYSVKWDRSDACSGKLADFYPGKVKCLGATTQEILEKVKILKLKVPSMSLLCTLPPASDTEDDDGVVSDRVISVSQTPGTQSAVRNVHRRRMLSSLQSVEDEQRNHRPKAAHEDKETRRKKKDVELKTDSKKPSTSRSRSNIEETLATEKIKTEKKVKENKFLRALSEKRMTSCERPQNKEISKGPQPKAKDPTEAVGEKDGSAYRRSSLCHSRGQQEPKKIVKENKFLRALSEERMSDCERPQNKEISKGLQPKAKEPKASLAPEEPTEAVGEKDGSAYRRSSPCHSRGQQEPKKIVKENKFLRALSEEGMSDCERPQNKEISKGPQPKAKKPKASLAPEEPTEGLLSESDEEVIIDRIAKAIKGETPLPSEGDMVYLGSGVLINKDTWENRLKTMPKDSLFCNDLPQLVWGKKVMAGRSLEGTKTKAKATPLKRRVCEAVFKGRLRARKVLDPEIVDLMVQKTFKPAMKSAFYEASRKSRKTVGGNPEHQTEDSCPLENE